MLSYYRSQHDNQSWLAALTAILDTSALLLAAVEGADPYQARLTFAMARHASWTWRWSSRSPPMSRRPGPAARGRLRRLREALRAAGLELRDGRGGGRQLAELRGLYEPFVDALARHFLLALPPVLPETTAGGQLADQRPWMRRSRGLGGLTAVALGHARPPAAGCRRGRRRGAGLPQHPSPDAQAIHGLAGSVQTIRTQMDAQDPDWEKVQQAGEKFVALAETLAKKSPRHGGEESWRRFLDQHMADARAMADAAQARDPVPLRAAHRRIAESCKSCHEAHRFRPGSGDSPE